MNDRPRAADLVKRLLVATTTGRLPEDLASWLAHGLDAFLRGEAATLCGALGLRAPGRTGRVVSVMALEARNDALRDAAQHMPGASETARCEALAAAVRRFETDVWPRVRALEAPPARFDETQSALWFAFRAGQPPRSTTGIQAALRQ